MRAPRKKEIPGLAPLLTSEIELLRRLVSETRLYNGAFSRAMHIPNMIALTRLSQRGFATLEQSLSWPGHITWRAHPTLEGVIAAQSNAS